MLFDAAVKSLVLVLYALFEFTRLSKFVLYQL